MTPGDPLQAEPTAAESETASAWFDANDAPVKADEPKAVASPEPDSEDGPDSESDAETTSSDQNDAETLDDDAWIAACRDEAEEAVDAEPSAETPETQAKPADEKLDTDLETLHDDSDNEAATPDDSTPSAAIEKTGDDAMSKFGHAIGALAERDLDHEDRGMEYAAEQASPSQHRDSVVAPHIAAAERELENSKSSGPVDIFDRIAQAAEAQFDDSRGSTAKRVSELVDDRRVGTKRWTPSKTMKQRMEKLEAARAAANPQAAPAAAEPVEAAPAAAEAAPAAAVAATVIAASAPTSSTATMVTPNAEKKPAAEPAPAAKAEPAPMQEEQKVVISRRDRQSDFEDEIETTSDGADEATAAEADDDAEELRVVPGARGRRRDRARKSRLDEDFEKIFDEGDKPSIGSLRRKLRSTAAAEAEAETAGDAPVAGATATEEEFGATGKAAAKTGLLSRLFKSKGAKTAAVAETAEEAASPVAQDEETLVAAFEADSEGLTESLDFEDDADDMEQSGENTRRQRQIALPIIGSAAMIGLGGLGYFLWKFFAG